MWQSSTVLCKYFYIGNKLWMLTFISTLAWCFKSLHLLSKSGTEFFHEHCDTQLEMDCVEIPLYIPLCIKSLNNLQLCQLRLLGGSYNIVLSHVLLSICLRMATMSIIFCSKLLISKGGQAILFLKSANWNPHILGLTPQLPMSANSLGVQVPICKCQIREFPGVTVRQTQVRKLLWYQLASLQKRIAANCPKSPQKVF